MSWVAGTLALIIIASALVRSLRSPASRHSPEQARKGSPAHEAGELRRPLQRLVEVVVVLLVAAGLGGLGFFVFMFLALRAWGSSK
jgi:hypothetical protein